MDRDPCAARQEAVSAFAKPILTEPPQILLTNYSMLDSESRKALLVVRPETVVSCHRQGFRLFWTWISRRKRSGRPGVSPEMRDLIRKMAAANPLWGAPIP